MKYFQPVSSRIPCGIRRAALQASTCSEGPFDRRGLSRKILSTVLSLVAGTLAWSIDAHAQVISQSGISYTGSVTATPLGDVIGMEANANFPISTTPGNFAFRGAITEGTNLWLLSNDADEIVKVDTTTGTMTGFALPGVGTSQNKFVGGVFDNNGFIWLIPFNANAVVRVTVATGAASLFNNWPAGVSVATGSGAFAGGVFDGTYVWLVPHNAAKIVRIDPDEPNSTQMHGVDIPGYSADTAAFWGGIFDGSSLWLVPWNADSVTKMNVTTETVTDVAFSGLTNFSVPDGAFVGGSFDGNRVWLAPYNADRIVSIAIGDDSMTGYGTADDDTQWPAGYTHGTAAFNGAVFDGADVWLVPFESDHLVKVDAVTGALSSYTNFPGTVTPSDVDKFAGAGFDGTKIYLVPGTRSGKTLVTVFSTNTPAVTSITRKTPAASDTNADSVVLTVAFNKTVSGVDSTDFIVNTSGTASGSISSVSASSGSSIDVTVGSVAGDGSMRLDLKPSGTGIFDAYTNAIAGGFTSGQSYAIDNTVPVITSGPGANAIYKTAFSYTVTASGLATSFGATGLPPGLSIDSGSGEITGLPTAPGGPTNVSITATDAAGNVGGGTLAITVAKRELTVTSITAGNKTYDGSAGAVIDTTSAALNGVVAGDSVTLDKTGATGAFADANAGTGKTVNISGLAITGASSANYTLTQPSTTADIVSKTLTASGIVASSKFYDGSTAAVVSFGGAALVGVVGSDAVTLNAGAGTGTFDSHLPGSGRTVTISGLTISGADSGNYALVQPATTASIVARLLTMSGVGTATKVYDGNAIASVGFAGATLVGIVSGDDVSFNSTGSAAAFDSAVAGAGKVIAITGLTLTGADAARYALVQPTTTGTITPKPLAATGVAANDKTYDGTTTATISIAGTSLVGLIGADEVSLDGSGASAVFAGDGSVGSNISVIITGLAVAGVDAANYSLTQPSATADITVATATVVLGGLSQSYNGGPRAATATTTPSGLSVNFTYDGSSPAPSSVGSYTVEATVDDEDYVGTATGTLVIGKGVATVSITGTTPAFDGTAKPVSVATVPAGLAVDVTYDGSATVPSAMGSYDVVATVVDANYTGSATATLVIGSNSRLINISARAQVGTNDDVLIPGFVISGTGAKEVLVRGIGPELETYGVEVVLANPTIRLFSDTSELESNTGWSTASNADDIAEAAATIGAFPLTAGSADSAILTTLSPGAYTVHLSGAGNTSGIGLVEVYDMDPEAGGVRLVNVSARALVGAGGDILIPGYVIDGDGPRTLLIRAVGPGLAGYGVVGVLEDPTITVYQESTEILANDDWGLAANAADVVAASSGVGAFDLETGSKDAALLIELPPGAYTVQVSGADNTGGLALVEIFEIR